MRKFDVRANGARRGARAVATACVPLLLLAGCAVGLQNVLVDVPPYVSQPEGRGASAATRGAVRIDAVRDARRDAVGSMIGERTTIGAVSMGKVDMKPMPVAMMTTLLQAEFTSMGFDVAGSAEQFRISAQLARFQVTTPATALYWDINGAIELELDVTAQGGSTHHARYEAQCTNRTYAWPSEGLIGGVVSACLKDIGRRIRGDAALAAFLGVRESS